MAEPRGITTIQNYCGWWLFDEEITNEIVDYNFYQQAPQPLSRWNRGRAEMPISLPQMLEMTAARDTLNARRGRAPRIETKTTLYKPLPVH